VSAGGVTVAGGDVASSLQAARRPRATSVESRRERGIRSVCRLMRPDELVNWTIRVTQE
jgi:hypothetical protein